jgi:hypothetical protein
MTRKERERIINLINEKLALCELPEDEFKEYEIEHFGMASRSTYPAKLGIAEATLEIIKGQLELDQKVEDIENERL